MNSIHNEKEITKVLDSFYNFISGKAKQKRDWKSFKLLFFKNALLIPYKFNNSHIISYDIRSYIQNLSGFLNENNFYEYGYNYKIEIFNDIAQVNSQYEARLSKEDKIPLKQGYNFVQLIKVGDWKITTMLWQDIVGI